MIVMVVDQGLGADDCSTTVGWWCCGGRCCRMYGVSGQGAKGGGVVHRVVAFRAISRFCLDGSLNHHHHHRIIICFTLTLFILFLRRYPRSNLSLSPSLESSSHTVSSSLITRNFPKPDSQRCPHRDVNPDDRPLTTLPPRVRQPLCLPTRTRNLSLLKTRSRSASTLKLRTGKRTATSL
jgi:hypothetical protein